MQTYKEFLQNNNLEESSLSRVFAHSKETGSFGVLTAFRGGYSLTQNRKRNKEIEGALKNAGYGFTKVKGSYPEEQDDGTTIRVDEESFIIILDKTQDSTKFKDFLIRLGKKYDQDSVLYKARGTENAILIGTNKSDFPGYMKEVNLGKWSVNRASEFYTKMKGSRSFTFEAYTGSLNTYTRKLLAEQGVTDLTWHPIKNN